MGEVVKVFVSGECGPCAEIKQLAEEGRVNQDIDLIDVTSDEGFPYIEKLGLSKVPSAYRGVQECKLQIDDENQLLIVNCDQEPQN
jgi:hypothetical protein